ncbi:hypothetical protein F5X99DRAFT_431472 [Biscogniauxia marginata]|nr:hypothetical protein F5X99DRAFT_431472 [Biscogniauxia marginata]
MDLLTPPFPFEPASYALETIHQIINSSPILHVSVAVPDSPFPMVLPMIGQMGSFARPSADTGDVLELYLHGYVSSRLMNLARKEGVATSKEKGEEEEKGEKEEETGEREGLPITVAASHVDGLVLSLTPNSHSYNYRSAVLFGYAELVADMEEKLYAMELITDSVVPGRYRNTRVPPTAAETQSTSVLRVRVSAGSAKLRSGPPGDDRADRADAALRDRVWTGVVPVRYALDPPLAGPYNRVPDVPAYVEEWRRRFNDEAGRRAVDAAAGDGSGKGKA